MTNLTRCPSLLREGFTSYSPAALRNIFDGRKVNHILDFDSPSNANSQLNAIDNVGRLSLSGAQSKFGLVLDGDRLVYSPPSSRSTYILKPRPTGYHIVNHDYCAANENLTMQLASQIFGIATAPNAIIFYKDGQMAYITRRFDVHPQGKYPLEDFAALMGYTKANGGSDFKYVNGSYEECAEVIRRYVKSATVDILRFFDIVVFNFITLNDDAHLKNFSLLGDGKEYHLSPAYDLINTSIQIYNPRIFALENGLFREGMSFSDTHQISRSDFLEFGRRIGLPPKIVEMELDRFALPNDAAVDLIRRSFLSDDLKKVYISGFRYRQSLIR